MAKLKGKKVKNAIKTEPYYLSRGEAQEHQEPGAQAGHHHQ